VPWDPTLGNSQILAIHAALLPTGEILYFGGDEHSQAQHGAGNIDHTRLYDTTNGAITAVGSPTTDIFCSGHAFLGDGRLLVGGGTETWGGEAGEHGHGAAGHFTGHRASWVFRPRARSWQRVADMRPQPGHEATNDGGGRWYPTLVTLSDGQVLATAAHPSRTDTRHSNVTPERYAASVNAWTLLTAQAVDSTWYARVHLLPDGTAFFVSAVGGLDRIYDPVTGTFVGPGIPAPADGIYKDGFSATSVMLPLLPGDGYKARILAAGGVQPVRINLGDPTPTWQNTSARQAPAAGRIRQHLSPVILPTGQVFLSGGVNVVDPEDPVREGEIYTPAIDWATGTYGGTESWATVEAAQVTRNYHSVALLMPDGRVWTAGSSIRAQQGDPNTVGEKRIEIYRPPYDGNPARPTLTQAPDNVSYGGTFEVRTPQASSIQRLALVRCGSITHAFDPDMRYVGLTFTHAGGDRLTVTGPPNSGVAPPGPYMLWIVDGAGLPCTRAQFVRVGSQRCLTITDRSTFSIHEVNALLAANPAAIFPRALYVVLDGFLPHELGSPTVAPTLTFTLDSPNGAPVPGMSASLREVLLEDPAAPPDSAQRATFVFDVRFTNATAFAFPPDARGVNVRATHGAHQCDAPLRLTLQPNPYMIDGPVSWLSIDLRVFQIRAGMPRAGVTQGATEASASTFIQQLLTVFNSTTTDEFHPFFDITADQQASGLELAREVNGQRVFNYAVAKVRYRAQTVAAPDVKVFFRAFNSVGTALEYNPQTYRRAGTGAAAIPLLGLQGTELVSIPYFAAPRVDTATQSMATQTDPPNRRTLNPSGAQESVGYYGCWLDFNQTTPRFPLHPSGDGPYTSRLSVQQLARGRHQCLVAEVVFDPDPIPPGATPGSSENLAQRNLAIVESSNPGSAATRTVQHTFEIKPSTPVPRFRAAAFFDELGSGDEAARFLGPDELVFTWGDLPPGTRATVYLPEVNVDEVFELASGRLGPPVLERVAEDTIGCLADEITYLPIPGGRSVNIPALLTVELPEGVRKGERYSVLVQQYSGLTGRIVGAFEMTIPVGTDELILPTEIRALSVVRHIAEAIPPGDRWFRVFRRYVGHIEERVEGLGGDPDKVMPSPDGTGKLSRPQEPDRCPERWVVPAVLATAVVLIAMLSEAWAAAAGALGAVLLLAALCSWLVRCRPPVCDLLAAPILGLSLGAAVLGFVALVGNEDDRVVETLAVVAILLAATVLAWWLLRCFCHAWCGDDHVDRHRPPRYPSARELIAAPQAPPPPPRPVEDPDFRGKVERGELPHDHQLHDESTRPPRSTQA